MSEIIDTSLLLVILTVVTGIIIALQMVYYYIKRNDIPISLVKNSLPFVGSTGAIIYRPISITDPVYDIFGEPIILTPEIQLDKDSHIYAKKNYCISKGYGYDFVENVCTHNKETCISDANHYLEWHEPYCVETSKLWKNMCGTYGFDFNQGKIYCDFETKLCGPKMTGDDSNSLEPVDLPSCVIKSDYCHDKGVSYNSEGLGDCYSNTPQKISQMVFGTTLTNLFHRNIDDAISSCGGTAAVAGLSSAIVAAGPLGVVSGFAISPECAKDMSMLMLTPFKALGLTVSSFYSKNDQHGWANQSIVGTMQLLIAAPMTIANLVRGLGSVLPQDRPGSPGLRPGGIF